jgi:long-chain-fatty-acid--[acyl-carrier-protein] ligase
MSLLGGFVRWCVGLRYKVTIEDEDLLKKYKDCSVLFLANHPATIDPVIVLSYLEPYLLLQPLAAEKFFKVPFMLFFLKKINALAVPEFDQGNNEYKAYRVRELTNCIREALKHKAKILLYPAGHLTDSPQEKIGGASLAFEIKNESKKMIGIAIDGLYGSIFSRYFEITSPSFLMMLLKGFKMVLLNGIFFLPKRHVKIRLFEFDESIRQIDDRIEFNKAVEEELNTRLSLKTALVDYGLCKSPERKLNNGIKNHNVDPKFAKEVQGIVESILKKKVQLDEHFSYDLGMDSLEFAEILTAIEQKYKVRVDSLPETIMELASLIKETRNNTLPKLAKLSKRNRRPIVFHDEPNLLAAFYAQMKHDGSCRMGQDQSLQVVSYKKAALIIEILSKKIQSLEGKYIGIMLPSSVMAYLLMFAVLKSGKTPVLLNWTGGHASLDFGIKLLDIQHILSSEKFLEKAFNIDLKEHFAKITLLEDLKSSVSVFDKINAYLSSLQVSENLSKAREVFKPTDVAVILFTSGSESMPKAVPLTHENISTNIKSLLKTGFITSQDRFLATLPPFHSFGCVVSGFLPMVTGLDTIYMPDPTDAIAIAYIMGQSSITLFCSAPSFLRQILSNGSVDDFNSLRLVVVGAEKLQDSVRELFAQKAQHAVLLEGYGITECSPVVTIQKNALTQGVGIPLEGIKILIVDPDSLTPLGIDHVGEILVHGKNVFNGYLGIKKDPFVEIDQKRWYRTGDRGKLTRHNELILEGRFKRFIKVSAEMISLGAIEEALEDLRESPAGLAQFAVIGNKSFDKMILVTIHQNLTLDEVNQHLRLKGAPKLAKISKILVRDSIPQLATGKIDYRSLDNETI